LKFAQHYTVDRLWKRFAELALESEASLTLQVEVAAVEVGLGEHRIKWKDVKRVALREIRATDVDATLVDAFVVTPRSRFMYAGITG
jgi:hypothetical protein